MTAHPERSIPLSDGRAIPCRPIEPGDAPRLQRFQARLSERSLHYRFFGVLPRLSDAQARQLAEVDYVNRFALVALDPTHRDAIVGVARFEREPEATEAEVALILADTYQGRGLGRAMLTTLIEEARERGIERLTALLLADNARAIGVLRSLGYAHTSRWAGEYQQVVLDIGPGGESD